MAKDRCPDRGLRARVGAVAAVLPGQALPPVRELAAELDINRNTVAAAYKRLAAAGIALTQGRLGTVIRDPYGAGEQEGALPDTPLTDLASGNPRREWLPDMAQAFATRSYRPRLWRADGQRGPGDLRARLAGAGLSGAFEINVTHGAVDAIERLLVSHLVPGDKVAVENPCFSAASIRCARPGWRRSAWRWTHALPRRWKPRWKRARGRC